jgi:hypothetical protein
VNPLQPRRQFFRSFARDLLGMADEVRGRPQMRLDELATLSDADLSNLRPALNAAFRLDGGRIVEGATEICVLDDIGRYIAGRFDGRRTLIAIANDVASAFTLDPQAALRAVRHVFLSLAKPMICIPSNLPGERP